MGTLKAQIEYMEATKRLVEWNAMCAVGRLVDRWAISRNMAAADRYFPVEKGGEKMSKFPSWVLLILNFLMSDLFDQLIEWAKDIVENLSVSSVTDKDQKRAEAVSLLRAKAALYGYKVTRWQAGQAVEAAYAELNPRKVGVVG